MSLQRPSMAPPKPPPVLSSTSQRLTAIDFCASVKQMVNDAEFCQKYSTKSAPLAMMAFGITVVEKILRQPKKQSFHCYFEGLTFTVPTCSDLDPHYRSIVGQKLLVIDWELAFGLKNIGCTDSNCTGTLIRGRTNFSKNKTFFPVFSLNGPPSWCMIGTLTCPCCRRKYDTNEAAILASLPAHATASYPVDCRYALTNHSFQLNQCATKVFVSLLLTYGNGELCSRLLFNSINRAYLEKVKSYYSSLAQAPNQSPTPYVEKDGQFVWQFPPVGDTICTMYDEAANLKLIPWKISDHDQHTREIQSVTCNTTFAQDTRVGCPLHVPHVRRCPPHGHVRGTSPPCVVDVPHT